MTFSLSFVVFIQYGQHFKTFRFGLFDLEVETREHSQNVVIHYIKSRAFQNYDW